MKQKLLDKILYVFSVEPYEITEDADKADVIKVQLECLDGYVELNPDLVSKLTPYNYHLFTVNKQEWADYVDEPDPAKKYKIEVTGVDSYHVNIAGYNSDGEVTWLEKNEILDGDGQLISIVYEYEAGLPFQVDERDCEVISVEPELSTSEDTLWGVGTSYVMPDSDVALILNVRTQDESAS
jgi:hypothetical protein